MGNIRRNLLNHLNQLGWMPEPYSSKEDVETVTSVGDLVAPKTPQNVIASNGTERISVEWDEVTTNADGSTCNDLKRYKVYYSSSSGIDPDDDTTYDGVEPRETLTWSQEVPVGDTRYYVVTAQDETGNESPASNEDSATSQSVTVDVDVSDYTDNFDEIQVGDGIIGLVFKQPDSGWSGYSHYKLYRDVIGGSSWTNIFEGSNPAYVDKGVSKGTSYKYKLTFVDVDGGETSGTVQDNSGTGYNPNNADNSNITGQTFLASNIVAQDEVRGDSLYAESQIVLGGVDNSGFIKSSNYSGTTIGSDTTDGFLIKSNGNVDFNDANIRGTLYTDDITVSGSGWDQNDLTIDGSLAITGDVRSNNYDSATNTGWKIDGGTDSAEFNDITARGAVEIDGSLSGSDITNSLTISGDVQGNYSSGTSGWKIDGNGNAEFNDADIRGTLYVGDITLDGNWDQGDITIYGSLSITGDVQSDGFVSGSTGWKIDGGTDSAEFNDITARGKVISEGSTWKAVMQPTTNPFSYEKISDGTQAFYVDDSGVVHAKDFKSTNDDSLITDGDLSVEALSVLETYTTSGTSNFSNTWNNISDKDQYVLYISLDDVDNEEGFIWVTFNTEGGQGSGTNKYYMQDLIGSEYNEDGFMIRVWESEAVLWQNRMEIWNLADGSGNKENFGVNWSSSNRGDRSWGQGYTDFDGPLTDLTITYRDDLFPASTPNASGRAVLLGRDLPSI